jgi:hypothetical protein
MWHEIVAFVDTLLGARENRRREMRGMDCALAFLCAKNRTNEDAPNVFTRPGRWS